MNGVRPYEPINWQQLVLDIRHACYGKGFQRAYRERGIDEATINKLARGEVREPRYTTGVRLLEWHASLASPDQSSFKFAPTAVFFLPTPRSITSARGASSVRSVAGPVCPPTNIAAVSVRRRPAGRSSPNPEPGAQHTRGGIPARAAGGGVSP